VPRKAPAPPAPAERGSVLAAIESLEARRKRKRLPTSADAPRRGDLDLDQIR
jgi:hypothetical protein